jgi:hypothetical protein
MELLKDSAKRTTSVQWPQAIDDRLQVLVAIAVRSYRRQRPEEFRQATGMAGELPMIRPPGPKRRSDDAPPA